VRRIIIGLTAAAMLLVGASAAYAALNSYTATLAFSGKAGTPKKPAAISFVQSYTASAVAPNVRTAPLTDIKTSTYGLKSTVTMHTPKCTDVIRMVVLKTDRFCSKKALVATGTVHSFLGGPDLNHPGTPCNPILHVWNGGPGKLWYFFLTDSTHTCGSLHTGDTQAFPATVKQVGMNLVVDVPQPDFISTRVAGHTNLYGSLVNEQVTWFKGFQVSTGCKAGHRPYTITFGDAAGSTKDRVSISHSPKC
jgi:hypothetical protein